MKRQRRLTPSFKLAGWPCGQFPHLPGVLDDSAHTEQAIMEETSCRGT